MTVLSVAQAIAPRIGVEVPDLLFGSTERTQVELAAMLNELAARLARIHAWSLLTRLHTITGDGVTETWDMPADYGWMPKDAQVWSGRWQRPLTHITSVDDWLRLDVRNYELTTGSWIILGGQMQFLPVLADAETAKFYYISDLSITGASGNQSAFMLDADTFRLPERLLYLFGVAQWRMNKGFDAQEDMRAAETYLAQLIEADKGARIITQSARRNVRAQIAYPWEVGV